MRPLAQTNLERRVVSLVNEERRRAGRPRLTEHPLLGAAARAHSADMAKREFYSHVSPEGSTVADRVAATGYLFAAVGENIAWGQENPMQVVTAWMRSPGHRANILHPDYTELGVGVADHRRGALVWTQNFGIPG
ncbi:CAP domain-containing protein [Actinoplanes sp. RD1]|uniref:CAP domain-containing protein n=1 Tax=Actinoplanes sp. RD1 TaxID=3064538 RepID=UPI002741FEAD|nr:CAP domain-containing protein [Actinoplanes sp. RD1]